MSEKTRMLAGALYDAGDPELVAERRRARTLCDRLGELAAGDVDGCHRLLAELLGSASNAVIQAPFHCDYGYNISLGANAYFNVGCVILDVMPVVIGANVLFGPGVHVYAASHPLSAAERRSGRELGEPVTIGDDVWLGGRVVVCPGVRIGSGSVIGAGSVVSRDIPPGVLAAGNPCRIVRTLA